MMFCAGSLRRGDAQRPTEPFLAIVNDTVTHLQADRHLLHGFSSVHHLENIQVTGTQFCIGDVQGVGIGQHRNLQRHIDLSLSDNLESVRQNVVQTLLFIDVAAYPVAENILNVGHVQFMTDHEDFHRWAQRMQLIDHATDIQRFRQHVIQQQNIHLIVAKQVLHPHT